LSLSLILHRNYIYPIASFSRPLHHDRDANEYQLNLAFPLC
jgi:hypothetical protein